MPAIEDIYVELQCQQKVGEGGPIEEFAPRRPYADDPEGQFMPKFYDRNSRVCSVFIPVFPPAQFFLNYHVNTPDDEELFYVFKLFVGGEEFVTWDCGSEHAFSGKTMFGLFDTSLNEAGGGKGLKKKAFHFNGECRVIGDYTSDKDEDRLVEVKVYRANKKLRVPRETEQYGGQGSNADIKMMNMGPAGSGHPKRFYHFGLLDPLNDPRATFRWYYRSWKELGALRLKLGTIEDEDIAAMYCSRGTRVIKDDHRKTLAVNSGPPSGRFPGPNNPPVRPAHYQSHVEVFRNPNQLASRQGPQVGRGRGRGLGHIPSTVSSLDVRHFNPGMQINQAHQMHQTEPFIPPHLRYRLPQLPSPGVTPLRSLNVSGNAELAGRLAIPPSMILPPNHPHSINMAPRKVDKPKPLPELPEYPGPPPPSPQ